MPQLTGLNYMTSKFCCDFEGQSSELMFLQSDHVRQVESPAEPAFSVAVCMFWHAKSK